MDARDVLEPTALFMRPRKNLKKFASVLTASVFIFDTQHRDTIPPKTAKK